MSGDLQNEILLALGRGDVRLFRNHTGKGWTGEFIRTTPDGFTILRNARRCTFGLAVGSTDIVGWRRTLITSDMIGQHHAVFSAIEIKEGTGRANADQRAFIDVVQKSGGNAGIARDIDDAAAILRVLS
jgi:VRR-NUC domain